MSWVKIDDKFTEHPKSISVGPLGIALQVAALCYANTHLTDGFIPYNVCQKLLCFEFSPPGSDILYTIGISSGMSGEDITWQIIADWLIDAGMWERVDGGFYIHDYPDYQPLKASVVKDREAAQQRMNKIRSGNVQANKERTNTEVRHKFKLPDPDPDPDPESRNPIPDTDPQEGGVRILSDRFTQITKIMPYRLDEWTEACREMFNAGVTPETLENVIGEMKNPPDKGKVLTIVSPRSCVKLAIAAQANGGSNHQNPDEPKYNKDY